MPMEAGAIGIRPVNQPQRPGSSEGVQRREDGGSGSGFRPQTSVAIKTAIDDMAGVLNKIATNEKLNMERLPEEVSQVVKNILQQAFSMESTLSQGIGSTLESQRFSMEQLSVFARMLTQIGALAEKGFSMELSDQMELLLKNFKALIVNEEGGNTLEPVLLSKAAFELIDSKNAEQLPQQLYSILSALSEGTSSQLLSSQGNQSESMAFLNQLVKFFMPRPSSDSSETGNSNQSGQNQQAQKQAMQSQARQFLQSMFGNLKSQSQSQQQVPMNNQGQPQQTFNNQQMQNPNQAQPQQLNNQQVQSQSQPQQILDNQQAQPQQMQNQSQQQVPMNNQGQPQQTFNNQQMQNPTQPQQFNNQQPQNQSQQIFDNQQAQPQQQMQSQNPNQPQQQVPTNNQGQPQQTFNNQQMQNPTQPQQFNNQQPQNQSQQIFDNQQAQPQQQMQSQNPNQSQQQVPMNNQGQPQQTFNNQQMQNPTQLQQFNNQQPQNQPQQAFDNQQAQPQQIQSQNPNQPQQQVPMNNQGQPQQTFNDQQMQNPNQPQQLNNQQPQNQPQQIFDNQQAQTQQMQSQNPNQSQQQVPMNNQGQPQQTFNNQQPQSQPQQFDNPQAQNQPQQTFDNSNLQAQQQLFSQKLQAQLDKLEQGDGFLAKQQQLKTDLQAAKTVLLKQPLQNNPQTMETMRNVAQLLMRNPDLTTRDAETLQNFINNKQDMLSEGEARHLQNLLRLCQQNVPITVQQAAVQQKLPDLPRLWAFMQLCDMAPLTSKLSAKAFKRAGRDVAEFASAMRQSMGGDNSSVQNAAQNNRSLQMMMPLYVGDNDTSYPTYLHVYDENEKDKETGEDKKETWLRICVLTDYIGAVELTFRMYEGNQLDMRFYFSERSAASEFRSYIPAIKDKLKETTLNVGEVRIGSVGEKMTN